jgi:hypothetical protein
LPRSTRSSGSQPEYFADRCLGKGAPATLIERGWIIHVISDHFPSDAQAVSDPEWIAYGLERGWGLLTQDVRIATQPEVISMLRAHNGSVFCLDSAELPVRIKAERFDSRRPSIDQHVRDRRFGFFVLHETGSPRRKRT